MNWLWLWCNWENGGVSLTWLYFSFPLRMLMTWSSSLICRGENLEKILLSNYALDHRKIFSRKCSSNLSESNLRSINILVDQLYYARCYHLQCCFLCSLSSPYSTTWFQMSFFFLEKGGSRWISIWRTIDSMLLSFSSIATWLLSAACV